MKVLTELEQQAFGLSQSALVEFRELECHFQLHQAVIDDYLALQRQLVQQGFSLRLVSGYRSYHRQLEIIRAKASGRRAVLNELSQEVDIEQLSDKRLLQYIMRWSALPGLSRHHFGTDIDVFDGAQMHRDQVQLIPSEVERGGPCEAMHNALDSMIESNNSFGFFRPYAFDSGAISPERWHLSHAPTARKFEECINSETVLALWKDSNLPLLSEIEPRIDEIIDCYVKVRRENLPDWLC